MPRLMFDTATPLAANATFTGTGRDTGDVSIGAEYARFGAQVNSDQPGTLYIDVSPNGTLWRQAGSLALTTAPYVGDLDVPIRYRHYRVRYVNGGTATGADQFAIHSSFRNGA